MYNTLGVIGCGNMAYALVKGLLKANSLKLYVNDINPERLALFAEEFQGVAASVTDLVTNSDMVLIAVKPYQMETLIKEIALDWQPDKVLVSIAAGISTVQIEQWLAADARIIRMMPNTPALVGAGLLAMAGAAATSEKLMAEVSNIFSAAGSTLVVAEKDMDAVVALSGSGPAYIFMILEALTEAGVLVGLSADIAFTLVKETMKGSLCLAEESGQHPAVLKQQVCSPGGTTIAAVRALEKSGFREALFAAVQAAYDRSREM